MNLNIGPRKADVQQFSVTISFPNCVEPRFNTVSGTNLRLPLVSPRINKLKNKLTLVSPEFVPDSINLILTQVSPMFVPESLEN